jgi:hypothetical protein
MCMSAQNYVDVVAYHFRAQSALGKQGRYAALGRRLGQPVTSVGDTDRDNIVAPCLT